MCPEGAGKIEIEVPTWYVVGNTAEYMYNPTANDRCSSSCMRVSNSEIVNDRIIINYDSMIPDCIEGTLIEIQCRNFYNPIVPKKTYGFNVFIYDNN